MNLIKRHFNQKILIPALSLLVVFSNSSFASKFTALQTQPSGLQISKELLKDEPQFECSGSEPIWALTIQSKGIFFKQLLGASASFALVASNAADGLTKEQMRVYRTESIEGKKMAATILIKENRECADGNADINYTHEVTFVASDRVVVGCCRKIPPLDKKE